MMNHRKTCPSYQSNNQEDEEEINNKLSYLLDLVLAERERAGGRLLFVKSLVIL
jgi:hypothetical protein